MRKRQWNLPPIKVPAEFGNSNLDLEKECPMHPNIFTLTPSVQSEINSRAHRVDPFKQHYRTPTSFVKLFKSYIVADGEQRMTVASGQYDVEQESAPIECVYDDCSRMWGLHVPYLDPSEWVTLSDYRANLKSKDVRDWRVVSSMTQAFWDSAIKLVNSKLFHGDLAGNLLNNIMVKTEKSSDEIAEVKIVDFGLCHQYPGCSEDALCAFYNDILDTVLDRTYG